MAEKLPDFEVLTAADVTEEVIKIAQDIVEGWYNQSRIDWEDVLDRMERSYLDDGRGIDMGADSNSPAVKKLKKVIRAWHKLA